MSGTSSDSYGVNESFAEGSSDSAGGSETFGENEANTFGTSSQWSHGVSEGVNISPMLFPVLGKEANAPIFRSIDEQIFIAMMKIARLKDREAYVLAGDMEAPELIRTPDINRPDLSAICTDLCIGWFQKESGLGLPLQEALHRLAQQEQRTNALAGALAPDEPTTARRRTGALKGERKSRSSIS